jgi:HSP20 family molecular chaperone IbpA
MKGLRTADFCTQCGTTEAERNSRLIRGERKTGLWRRCFTLSYDVNMKDVKASLEAGLLSTSIKRTPTGAGDFVGIEIDDTATFPI